LAGSSWAYRYGEPAGPEPYDPSRLALGARKLRIRSASARCVTGERSAVMSWATNWPKNGHTAAT
jgi:hypothetical protein